MAALIERRLRRIRSSYTDEAQGSPPLEFALVLPQQEAEANIVHNRLGTHAECDGVDGCRRGDDRGREGRAIYGMGRSRRRRRKGDGP